MPDRDVVAIGSTVRARGFEFRVIANELESYYGYCPEGAVIARNSGGETILSQGEFELVIDGRTNWRV